MKLSTLKSSRPAYRTGGLFRPAGRFAVGLLVSAVLIVSQISAFTYFADSFADFAPQTGFPHGEGITNDTPEDCSPGVGRCPNGTPFASFNNFTDQNSPTFPDERRFVKARRIGVDSTYADPLNFTVSDANSIRMVGYVHNTGDPAFNDNGNGPSVAKNVKTFSDLFNFDSTTGTFRTATLTGANDIRMSISASNTNPGTVSDTVTLNPTDANQYILEYVPGSLLYTDLNLTAQDTLDPALFFDDTGDFLGSPVLGSGNFYGCEEFRGWIYFDVIVRAGPANVSDLSIDKSVVPASPTAANTSSEDTATVNYTITVTNRIVSGVGQTATNVVVSDVFQNGTNGGSVTSISNVSGATLGGTHPNTTLTIASIAPGATATVTFTGTVDRRVPTAVPNGATSDITNTATITNPGGVTLGTPSSDTATVRIIGPGVVTPVSELTIDKTVTPASPTPANTATQDTATVQYTIRVTNRVVTGIGQTATNVVVSDVFQNGTNGGSVTAISNVTGATMSGSLPSTTLTIASIAPGATATITFNATVDRRVPTAVPTSAISDITNTATITNGGGATIGTPSSDTATVRIVGPGASTIALFSIEKQVQRNNADTPNTAYQATNGETLAYQITVSADTTNTVTLQGIRVTDTILSLNPTVGNIRNITLCVNGTPCQTVASISSIPLFDLAAGQSATISYDATTTFTTPGATSAVQRNDASADPTTPDLAPLTDPAHVFVHGPDIPNQSRLTIDKSVTPLFPTPVNTATTDTGTARYTIAVSNTVGSGTGQTATNVTVSDVFSPATNGGAPTSYTVVSATPAGTTVTGTLPNLTITIPSLASNQTATIVLDTVFNRTSGANRVPDNGTSDVTNTVTITNGGGITIGTPNTDIAQVRIVGPNPVVCNPVLTVEKTITVNTGPAQNADNVATAARANNTNTLLYEITIHAPSANGACRVNTIDIADTIASLVHVTNIRDVRLAVNGNGVVSYPSFAAVPVFSLDSGHSATLSYVATASCNGLTTDSPIQRNTATVTGTNPTGSAIPSVSDDANLIVAGCVTPPTNRSHLSIDKSVSPTSVTVTGSTATAIYTIRVQNTVTEGVGVDATNVVLTDVFATPSNGGSITSVTNLSGATMSGTLPNTTLTIASIARGTTATVTFTATFNVASLNGTSCFPNTATITNGGGVTIGTPNTDTAQVCVSRDIPRPRADEPELDIEKSVRPRTVRDGDTATYTITIENNTNVTTDVDLTDTIGRRRGTIEGRDGGFVTFERGSLRVRGISSSNWDGSIDDRDGIEFEDVEPGDEITITYDVTVSSGGMNGSSSRVENTAELSTGEEDDAELTIVEDEEQIIIIPQIPATSRFAVTKEASPSVVNDGDTVTYTVKVANIGDVSDIVQVIDSFAQTGVLYGTSGGSLTYVAGSMTVSGAQYDGDIATGMTLSIMPGSYATITYQAIAKGDDIASCATSPVTNTVLLSTGEQSQAVATIAAICRRGPTRTPTTGAAVPFIIFTSMGMGGLTSLMIRRKRKLDI